MGHAAPVQLAYGGVDVLTQVRDAPEKVLFWWPLQMLYHLQGHFAVAKELMSGNCDSLALKYNLANLLHRHVEEAVVDLKHFGHNNDKLHNSYPRALESIKLLRDPFFKNVRSQNENHYTHPSFPLSEIYGQLELNSKSHSWNSE